MISKSPPGLPTLADTLRRVLDCYERDSISTDCTIEAFLDQALEDEVLRVAALVPPEEQLERMASAARATQSEIERKTLLRTASNIERYRSFLGLLGHPDKLRPPYPEYKATRIDVMSASYDGLTVEELSRTNVEEEIGRNKIDVEMTRFFLDRLDSLVNGVEKLSSADFKTLVPISLSEPFRQLHMNAVLGNCGTVAILCGAILEYAYQDLLPTAEIGGKAIEEAKVAGLLDEHLRIWAYEIKDKRDDLVHGKLRYHAISSDMAWGLIAKTRGIIEELYRSRLENGRVDQD